MGAGTAPWPVASAALAFARRRSHRAGVPAAHLGLGLLARSTAAKGCRTAGAAELPPPSGAADYQAADPSGSAVGPIGGRSAATADGVTLAG